jgi:hypothetical protein
MTTLCHLKAKQPTAALPSYLQADSQWSAAQGGQRRKSGALAALVLRDNLRNRTRIERTYRKAIASAHQ